MSNSVSASVIIIEYMQTLLESEVTEIAASLSNPLSLAGQGAIKTGSSGVTRELVTVRTFEQSRKFQENFRFCMFSVREYVAGPVQ